MKITASMALVTVTIVLVGAYVWKTFYLTAPFVVLVSALVPLYTTYIIKRLLQKKNNDKKA